MMLPDLLSEDLIATALPADRWEAISQLTGLVQAREFFPSEVLNQILDDLRAREQQLSTGVGFGLAIPHVFVRGITSPKLSLGRCAEGIEFDAVDARPVHIVILLLVPEGDYRSHIEALSCVAKCFADPAMSGMILAARDADEILQIIRRRFRAGECPPQAPQR